MKGKQTKRKISGWMSGSIHLCCTIFDSFTLLTSHPVGVSVCIAPNFSIQSSFFFFPLYHKIALTNCYFRLHVSFVQFVTIATAVFSMTLQLFVLLSARFLFSFSLSLFLPYLTPVTYLFLYHFSSTPGFIFLYFQIDKTMK